MIRKTLPAFKRIIQGAAVLIGWLCIMAAYFAIYDDFEFHAIPVAVTPFKDVFYEKWEDGYVVMAGSFASDTISPDEELPLQTSNITCSKDTKTCRIATARIIDNAVVVVDDETFDIANWTNQTISFDNGSPICSILHYTIDRPTKSLRILAQKKQGVTEAACKSSSDEQNISLRKGSDVYWTKIQNYERKNGKYFHLLLTVMNGAYALLVIYLFKRRPEHQALHTATASVV
jgi:hypothetical protein